VYDDIFVRVAGLLLGRWREADAFANPAAQISATTIAEASVIVIIREIIIT
jgi:hypothetical protein